MNNQRPVRLPSKSLSLHQVVAARLWFRVKTLESIAADGDLSVSKIHEVIDSPEYVEAVANLMLSTRSPANLKKWIKKLDNPASHIANRMWLAEDVAEELIGKVLDRIS